MKKMLLLSIVVLFTTIVFAQNDEQQFINKNLWNNKPDLVIKGDELKNFPGQLNEMLLGRLPGVNLFNGEIEGSTVALIYIVDGFVWPSIVAININNVEEIAYYRGGLSSKLGVQNISGGNVLYITTKTAKFKQALQLEVNTLLGFTSLKNNGDKDHTTLQSYHLALAEGLEQFSWRISANFNKDTRNLNQFDFTHQFQLNSDFRFSPLKWLDFGLNMNYSPLRGQHEENSMAYSNQAKTNLDFRNNDWSGIFNLKISPVKGLVNNASFSKNNIQSENRNNNINYNFDGNLLNRHQNFLRINKFNSFSFLNDLSYSLGLDKDRIKLKAATIFQYENLEILKENTIETYSTKADLSINQQRMSKGITTLHTTPKTYTFVGDFSINLYDILTLQAGLRKDKEKGEDNNEDNIFFTNIQVVSKYAPYYYAGLNLKPLLLKNITAVNEILLFGSYGQYTTELSGFKLINDEVLIANDYNGREKMKVQNFGIKTSFFNNRLHLTGDWSRNDNYDYCHRRISYGIGFINYTAIVPIINKSWRVWAFAEILRDTKFKWSTGFNIFKNKLETIDDNKLIFNVDNNKLSKAIQTGMQHHMSYKNLFIDLNASAYFNHSSYNPLMDLSISSSNVIHNYTLFNLNYLSAGYDLKSQIGRKSIKKLNLSFVARNLFQYKKDEYQYPLSKTLGFAVNASF